MRQRSAVGVTSSAKRALGAAAVAGVAGLAMAPAAQADEVAIAAAAITEVSGVQVTASEDEPSSPKLTQPLLDTPQTITVVPAKVIRDQGASTLRDVVRNVPGISMQAGEGGVPNGDTLTVRGFAARTDILIDGVRDIGGYTRDSFNIEQVEVAKGPASAYSGRGSTGGSINQVSKAPNLEDARSLSLTTGTDNLLRAAADLNQVLDADGGVAVRLNLLDHSNDQPRRDQVYSRRWGVAPSLVIGLGRPTTVTLSLFHLAQDNLPDYGVPWVPDNHIALADHRGDPAPVPASTWYGVLARDFEDVRTDVVTLKVKHDLSPAATLTNQFRYGETRRQSVATAPRLKNIATTDLYGEGKARDSLDSILANQTNLTLRFATGPVGHTVATGVEVSRERFRNLPRTYADSLTDLYAPDPNRAFAPPTMGVQAVATGDTVAAYAFDTIALTPQWLVSTGLRYDRFDMNYDAPPLPELARTDEMTSGRFAVIYKPNRRASVYAGISTAFNPSAEGLTLTAATALLAPEETRSYEFGGKWELPAPHLTLSAAVFRTEKINARTNGLPGDPPTVLAGEQRVDGFEVAASGMVTPGWTVIAAYTWMDGEIVASNDPAERGKRTPNTPDHSASLWTTYEIADLTLGGGVSYVGERYANTINTRLAEGYWLADLMAAYQITEAVSVRLNVYNLADETYFDNIGGGHVVPGVGRSAALSLNLDF